MPTSPERVRLTVSLSREIAEKIDDLVDGVRVRNRSHAIETLVTDSLDILQVHQAVILAGGEQALKRIAAIKQILPTLYKHGISDIYIAVGYLGERVKQQLADQKGINISYLETQQGTGGALLELKSKLRDTFLVINIYQPVEIDFKSLLRFHREHRPVVTLATRSLKDLDGIYVMEPKVFQAIPDGFVMLEETVFHELTKQGKLLSYPILQEK